MKLVFSPKWVFIILPLLYLVLSLILNTGIKQFYINHCDPAYAYLMNGTNIASGHLHIGNMVHPGIPVDCFAAIIIFIKHLFAGNTILYQDVLMHPESYLFICSLILALLFSLATYYTGAMVYHHSENILLALLFQVSPLFYDNMISTTVILSAESSITIVGVLFMAYLYVNTIPSNQTPGKSTTNKNVILFGLFTALLFTTKIYCFPVILLVLFMIRKGKQRILYLASSGLFSLLLLFPLYNQLRNWLGSIKAMVFHSGPYGQGSSEIINSAIYKSNLLVLFSTHYIFAFIYLVIITAFLVSLWGKLKDRRESSSLIFPITGILMFFTLFILVVAKQYKFDCPNPLTHTVFTITNFYYFILPITCFPLVFIISYKILSPLFSFKYLRLYKQKLLYGLLAIFIIIGMQQAYAACYKVRNNNVSFEKTRSFMAKWKNTPLILIADGGEQVYVEPALLLGISFSGKWDMPQYFDFLKKIYPTTYLYELGWKDALTFWGDETNISNILRENNKALVYISGADSSQQEITLKRICMESTQKEKVYFKKIYSSENRYENVYLVIADTLR